MTSGVSILFWDVPDGETIQKMRIFAAQNLLVVP
jgi:hypothetical protein